MTSGKCTGPDSSSGRTRSTLPLAVPDVFRPTQVGMGLMAGRPSVTRSVIHEPRNISDASSRWAPYISRYRDRMAGPGTNRDIVAEDARKIGETRRSSEHGLRAQARRQPAAAGIARRTGGPLSSASSRTLRSPSPIARRNPPHSLFEEATIEAESVHLAFAVMVLEHLPSPQGFWEKLRATLRQGEECSGP